MQFLHPIKIGKTQVRLCVNDTDFLAIVRAVGAESNGRSDAAEWLGLLIQCPMLLITAKALTSQWDGNSDNFCQLANAMSCHAEKIIDPRTSDPIADDVDLNQLKKFTKTYLNTLAAKSAGLESDSKKIEAPHDSISILTWLFCKCTAKSQRQSSEFIDSIFAGFDFEVTNTKTATKTVEAGEMNCGEIYEKVLDKKNILRVAKNWQVDGFLSRENAAMIRKNAIDLASFRNQFNSLLAQKKLAAMKQLAYGASHEINNPLGNIASRAQMLASRQEDPELKRQLATIYQQAMRAHEMISDMMLFAHPPKLIIGDVSLNDILENAMAAVSADRDRLSIDEPAEPVKFQGDREKLIEMLGAVLQNACEASPAASPIHISIESENSDFIQIVVENTSDELSPLVAEHMFDPFFSGREAGRGLGFGLSKAYRVAELHGGGIQFSHVTTDPTKASTSRFVISIPGDAKN